MLLCFVYLAVSSVIHIHASLQGRVSLSAVSWQPGFSALLAFIATISAESSSWVSPFNVGVGEVVEDEFVWDRSASGVG